MVLAITHVHTTHSWDCRIPPAVLVKELAARQVGLAVVSDHDSFEGARECRELTRELELDLRIPTAAEIRTDRGDVIVVLDEAVEPPPIDVLKKWHQLVPAVRDLDGLVWLPHPYQSHEFIEELAVDADVIEIFNGRCSEEQNRNAKLLCDRHGAVAAYGADVHLRREIGNVAVEYPDEPNVLRTLLAEPRPVNTQRTTKSNYLSAEVTYALHRRSPSRLAWFGLQWLVHRRRERTPTD